MMAQIEPMDIDSINSEFDNKENSLHHNNVLPRTPCTDKEYEELDDSELNMKLRYSITPFSSPMSKSLTVNSLDNVPFDSEDFINNVVINENCNLTRSLNSTITRNDKAKSLKSLPLQVLSTELVTESRSASVHRTLDRTSDVQDNDVTITLTGLTGENFVDDNISLPSTSSSVAQTPEVTTPTKEIQKHDGGSPIMRGLKSVLNMFRSSQSPISPADVILKQEIFSPNETFSDIVGHKSQPVTASTPISNKLKEASGSQRSSPLKESIVFNDDLERELQWKDETTILFKEEKIPIHKLLLPQSLSSLTKTSETASMSSKVDKENFNLSVEPMDISNNDSFLDVEVANHLQPGVITNDLIVESDGEFVDCETTINNDISSNKIIENLPCMDNQNTTLQQSYNNLLINNKASTNSIQCNTSVTFVKDCDLSNNYNKNGKNSSKEQCNNQERQKDALIKDHDAMPIAATVLLIENQNEKNEMLIHHIDWKSNAPYLKELNEKDIKSSDDPNYIDAKSITHTGKYIKTKETVTDLKQPSDIPLPDEDDVENTLNVENNNTFNISNPILQNNTETISTVEHKMNETYEHLMNKSIEFNETSIIKESYLQSTNKETKNLKILDYDIRSETKVGATSQVINEETVKILNVDEIFHTQDINTKDTVGMIESPDNQKQLIENTYLSVTNNMTLTTERNLETDDKTITDSLEIINDLHMKAVFISNKFEGGEEISQNVNDNVISNQENDQTIVTDHANEITVKNEGNTINIENQEEDDKTVSVSTRKSSQTFNSTNCIIYPQNNDKNVSINTSNFKENDDKIFNINMEDSQRDEDELKRHNILTEKITPDLQKPYNAMDIMECNKAEKEIYNDEKVCLCKQENEEPYLNEVINTIEENCVSRLENHINGIEQGTNATFNMSIDQESEIENKETKRTPNECPHDSDEIIDKSNIIIDTDNCNIQIASETTEYTLNQENVFVCKLEVDNRVTSDEINANPGDNSGESTVLEHLAGPTTDAPNTLKFENNNQVILLAEQKNSSSEITAVYKNHDIVNTSRALNFSTETGCEIDNYLAVSDVTTTGNLASSRDNIDENNIVSEQTMRHTPCIIDVLKSENDTGAIQQINSASENSLDTNQIEFDLISVEDDIVKQKHDLDHMGNCLNFSKEVDCEVKKDESKGEKLQNMPLDTLQHSSQNESYNSRSRKSSESSERNLDVGDGVKTEIESQVSPPLSPVISSKGYNFNFDEMDDPFATKTKIRLSPSPEDVPKSYERKINKAISIDMKKDLQKRTSLPAKKQQPLIKNKIRSSFGDGVDYIEIESTKAAELVVAADMNNTVVNAPNDNSRFPETLPSNSVDKNESVPPSQLASCPTNETHNNIDTLEDNKNIIIREDQLKETDTLSHGAEVTSNIRRQNILSEDKYESKNVFNLPEMSTDMNFNSFVPKSNVRQSSIPETNICTSSFKVPGDLSDCDLKSVYCTYSNTNITEKVGKSYTDNKADHDSFTASSSKTTEDATVREANTEDEDTVEGPFFDSDNLNDGVKMSDYVVDNEDMMHFTDMLAQGTDESVDNGEMFIDAEAFEFLLNKNKSNVVVDSGKESLFLKFDPLFAKRMSSDGVLAALNKVQKRQSTPKRISRAPTVGVSFYDKTSPGSLNANTDVNNILENNFDDPNTTVSKPMMVVNPAIISPRNKTITTPLRTNRRSLTFTSPAIAVIDRLLSLSGNNSTLNNEATTTSVRREPNETDVALTQLRELLAEKEIHVQNLRLESKELKERLSTLETQVDSLESESEQRLRKIKELNERIVEKTNINKSMATVVEEYERTIASLIADTEQDKKRHAEERMRLINERDEQTAHLASMEISYNDLHSKYEKCKQVILSYKAKEDTYKRSNKEFEENLLKMQNTYELLKQHATSKLNQANQELDKLKRAHEAEVLKLNAMIKRKDLHITSLEETLAQKTKANDELTAICDELISKVG